MPKPRKKATNAPDEQTTPATASAPATASDAPAQAKQESADTAPQATGDTTASRPDPDRIARRAYELYLARGGSHGRELEDWLAAEREFGQGFEQSADSATSGDTKHAGGADKPSATSRSRKDKPGSAG